jgi:hypothetical protein
MSKGASFFTKLTQLDQLSYLASSSREGIPRSNGFVEAFWSRATLIPFESRFEPPSDLEKITREQLSADMMVEEYLDSMDPLRKAIDDFLEEEEDLEPPVIPLSQIEIDILRNFTDPSTNLRIRNGEAYDIMIKGFIPYFDPGGGEYSEDDSDEDFTIVTLVGLYEYQKRGLDDQEIYEQITESCTTMKELVSVFTKMGITRESLMLTAVTLFGTKNFSSLWNRLAKIHQDSPEMFDREMARDLLGLISGCEFFDSALEKIVESLEKDGAGPTHKWLLSGDVAVIGNLHSRMFSRGELQIVRDLTNSEVDRILRSDRFPFLIQHLDQVFDPTEFKVVRLVALVLAQKYGRPDREINLIMLTTNGSELARVAYRLGLRISTDPGYTRGGSDTTVYQMMLSDLIQRGSKSQKEVARDLLPFVHSDGPGFWGDIQQTYRWIVRYLTQEPDYAPRFLKTLVSSNQKTAVVFQSKF